MWKKKFVLYERVAGVYASEQATASSCVHTYDAIRVYYMDEFICLNQFN